MPSKILVEINGPVTTIVINRPEVRNALDQEAAADLAQAFHDFDADKDACIAVLTGAEGAFCAGADLKELSGRNDYKAWAGDPAGPTHKPLTKPLIAAVAGHACAGGLGLALYCDIRIAEESAVFGVFSRRWGVPMSDGTTVRLPRVVGMGPALDMLLTGRAVGAQEAKEIGLVTRVVAKGESRKAAEDLALQMAGFPQIALRSDRRSMLAQDGIALDEAIQFETVCAHEAKEREAMSGAARFAQGAGRHGSFKD